MGYFDEQGRALYSPPTAQVVELLATLARVPTRHKVFLDSDVYFSERDLLRIHDRCMEVLELMGKREEYERRTRTDA